MAVLVVVAILAGALTTISGFGGGLILLLAVSALVGAKQALAITAIALLFANLHRIWMYRRDIGAAVTVPLLLGLIPGSLLGAVVAAHIPELVVQLVMLGVVGLGLARVWFGWEWRPGRRMLSTSGFVVGVLAGSAGGAGFLIGPVVLAAGLVGRPYLATAAASAIAMHVARIIGYSAGALVTVEVLRVAAMLAPALLIGNVVGDRARDLVPEVWHRRIELGAPVVCVGLALAGLG